MSDVRKQWVKPKVQTLVAGAAEGGGTTNRNESGGTGNIKS